MKIFALVSMAALLCAGCGAMTPTTEYKAEAPVFTQEEKAEMGAEEIVAVHNDSVEEHDDIIICSKEVITGSHKKRRVCRTIGERRSDRESAQDALHDVASDVGTSLDPGGIN